MKSRKTGRAIAAAAMLTIASMTLPMPSVAAEEVTVSNVLVLGDSISTGYGLPEGSASYVERLETQTGLDFTNLAQDGLTTAELLQQLQSDATTQDAVASADVILVSIGANDILQPVLNNDVVSIQDYTTITELGAAIKANQIAFQKYLRANMPTAVANANTNIDQIITQLQTINSNAKLVFQSVYDPLSVDQDDTGLSDSAMQYLNVFSSGQMYQYLNGSGSSGTYITTGLNENLQAHADNGDLYLADVYNAFLHHAWTYLNISDMDVHPNASGHVIIAKKIFESGYLPATTFSTGDIDGDGIITVSDAVSVLTEYAKKAAGQSGTFIEAQNTAADVNGDGVIDVSDAVGILTYYAKAAAGQEPTFE